VQNIVPGCDRRKEEITIVVGLDFAVLVGRGAGDIYRCVFYRSAGFVQHMAADRAALSQRWESTNAGKEKHYPSAKICTTGKSKSCL
jgi:hypothetical protein